MITLKIRIAHWLAALFAALAATAAHAEASADALLSAANAFVNFEDSTTQMQMRVFRDDQVEAEYEMRVMKLDSQRMRIEFTQPAREKGRKLLRVGDKMWMYLPDLGKPIVISARQSFLGSSVSNGDLMRTDLVSDYTPALLREEPVDGTPAEVLELKARSPEVAYDRILMWIDKTTHRPLRQEFYTLSGKRIKTITYGKPVKLNGIVVNSEMNVESVLTPRERTLLTVSGLTVDQKLPAALFQKDSIDR